MNLDRTTVVNLRRDRNVIAAVLSIVPGLGHIYKGHYGPGLAILLLGVPIGIWVGVLLSLATAGVGLLLPLCAWGMVAMDAYAEKDRRRHHLMGVL